MLVALAIRIALFSEMKKYLKELRPESFDSFVESCEHGCVFPVHDSYF
jgi:hypothetical protein